MKALLIFLLVVFLFGCSPKTENESFEGVDVISGAASVIGDESDDTTWEPVETYIDEAGNMWIRGKTTGANTGIYDPETDDIEFVEPPEGHPWYQGSGNSSLFDPEKKSVLRAIQYWMTPWTVESWDDDDKK